MKLIISLLVLLAIASRSNGQNTTYQIELQTNSKAPQAVQKTEFLPATGFAPGDQTQAAALITNYLGTLAAPSTAVRISSTDANSGAATYTGINGINYRLYYFWFCPRYYYWYPCCWNYWAWWDRCYIYLYYY